MVLGTFTLLLYLKTAPSFQQEGRNGYLFTELTVVFRGMASSFDLRHPLESLEMVSYLPTTALNKSWAV